MIAGRFRILATAGRGGSGTVYRARDHKSGETVAVKVVEIKSEAEETGDLATGKIPGFSGSVSLNKSNPDDNFLLAGSGSLTTEQSQQTPVDQKDKQQKTNTAAKIRTALEASGLAGNLTPHL